MSWYFFSYSDEFFNAVQFQNLNIHVHGEDMSACARE